MLNVPRQSCVRSVLFCLLLTAAGSTAKAQATSQNQLSTVNSPASTSASSVSASSTRTPTASPPSTGSPTRQSISTPATRRELSLPSATPVPALRLRGQLRLLAIHRTFTPFGSQPNGGVQQNASEYTLGYVVHTRKQYFGLTPFASGGAGTTVFRPDSRAAASACQNRPAPPTTSRSAPRPPSCRPTSAFAPSSARSSSKHPTSNKLPDHPAAHHHLRARVRLLPAFLDRRRSHLLQLLYNRSGSRTPAHQRSHP